MTYTKYNSISDIVIDDSIPNNVKAEALLTYQRAEKTYNDMTQKKRENNDNNGTDFLEALKEKEEFIMHHVNDVIIASLNGNNWEIKYKTPEEIAEDNKLPGAVKQEAFFRFVLAGRLYEKGIEKPKNSKSCFEYQMEQVNDFLASRNMN